jgi:hypothetical protein
VIDVVAEVGVSNLLHREAIFPSGDESCRGVYVTLVEDLMYRHDQEFGGKWASPRTSPNTASVTVRLVRSILSLP